MQDFREEEVVKRPYDGRLMRRLLGFAVPEAPVIALCIALLALGAAAELARPYLIKVAIDQHLTGWTSLNAAGRAEAGAALWRIAFLLIGIQAAGFVVSYLQAYLLQRTGQRIIYRIRQQVFQHLMKLSLSFFDRNPVGRIVTRVANDTEALNEMYTSVVVNLFRDLFVLVGVAAVMVQLSPRLAGVILLVMPVVAVAAYLFQYYSRDAWRKVRVRLARINAFLAEHVSGMAVVQIFGRENRQAREFDGTNRAYLQASMQQLYVFAFFRPFISFLNSLTLATLVWYGGGQVLHGAITFGVVFAFSNYIQQMFGPIEHLAEKFNIIQQAMASAERLFGLLDEVPAVADPAVADSPVPVRPDRPRGAVEFDHVWFAYEGDNWVLRDVSFRVESGQTVAFVGHTGAGKSSIMNLVLRFYDVQRGAVRVDGVDVRTLPQADLRRHMAVVLQDVFLFTGDIAGNIRLGNTAVDDLALHRAAQAVGVADFASRLPRGYQERVVERGATLSHGQRQLIAFARALAFDPAILVLDEATASVDSETEHQIQTALGQLTRGRTTLIVAHRLSTIQHADRVIVLHKGRIREEGTHQELLALGGLYDKLWQLQRAEAGARSDAVARDAGD